MKTPVKSTNNKTQSVEQIEARRLAESERVSLGGVGYAGFRGDEEIYGGKRTRPIAPEVLDTL